MDTTHRGRTAPRAVPDRTTAAERFSRWGGAAFAGVAIVGFGLTGFDDPTSTSGHLLGVFEVNPLHNGINLLVGVTLLVAGAASADAARTVTLLVAAAYGVVGLLGGSLVGTDANVLALNHADNVLHLLIAAVATACVLGSPSGRDAPR